MNELLPCPFCGGPNIERVMLGIECADCGARVPDDLTWNRRALLRETGTPEAAMDELNAALLRAPDLPVAGVRIAAPPAAVPGIPAQMLSREESSDVFYGSGPGEFAVNVQRAFAAKNGIVIAAAPAAPTKEPNADQT